MTVTELKQQRRQIRSKLTAQIRAIDTQIAVISQTEKRLIPNNAQVIGMVRRWIRMGDTMANISSELNRRGIRQPNGKRWSVVGLSTWIKLNEVN